MDIVRVGPRAPNLNAFCARWVLSLKAECLSRFIVFGEAHLRYLIDSYVRFYSTCRPHQGLDNKPLALANTSELQVPAPLTLLDKVVCDEHLGGLLRHYRRAA
jgi:transposase InsO family protein